MESRNSEFEQCSISDLILYTNRSVQCDWDGLHHRLLQCFSPEHTLHICSNFSTLCECNSYIFRCPYSYRILFWYSSWILTKFSTRWDKVQESSLDKSSDIHFSLYLHCLKLDHRYPQWLSNLSSYNSSFDCCLLSSCFCSKQSN